MSEKWNTRERIYFGNYPQTKEGEKKPIEWKILKVEGENAFVTSVYALDAQPYDNNPQSKAGGVKWVDWKGCSLRTWLNQSFIKAAFSEKEQACLLAADELGDKVSLLDMDQINEVAFFPSDASTGCRPSDYAADLYVDGTEKMRQDDAKRPLPVRATYWLKNRGVLIHGDEMEGVLGVIMMSFALGEKMAVRPVLMLDINGCEALWKQSDKNQGLRGLFKKTEPSVHRFPEEEKSLSFTTTRKGSAYEVECPEYNIHIEVTLPEQTPGKEAGKNAGTNAQKIDPMMAFIMHLNMAIGGDVESLYQIGELFWNINHDHREAVRWYRYAANQGHPASLVNLAEAYSNGDGAEKNDQMAFFYTRQAAEKGFPLAMANLSLCYANGLGTEQDLEKALEWDCKAEAAGVTGAGKLKEDFLRGLAGKR